MSNFFLTIVNMSISAGWIVLAVMILRLLLKKAPKWITVLLWGMVAIRLVFPFSIESIFSLIPSTETISPDIMMEQAPKISTGIPVINNAINPVISESFTPDPAASINPLQVWIPILAIIWICGMAGMLIYTIISYFRIKRQVCTAICLHDNFFQSENVSFPFVLGIFRPRIYLPFNMNEQNLSYVIEHEQAHISRKDHLWKPIGFLLLTLHWFNPLMWVGYVLLCRDIELACDEKVIKDCDNEQKADYSQALLSCSIKRHTISACPLAFGEISVKDRVKSVLNYTKPAFWIVITAVIACAAVAVCFLTNPKKYDLQGVENQFCNSDLAGVSVKIVDCDLSAPDPFLEIEWTNHTSKEIVFGEAFAIYQNIDGKWDNCSITPDPIWYSIAYIAKPLNTARHKYKLNGQIMTQPGKYRFEAEFFVDNEAETKYKAWIEFELQKGIEGISVHTFKAISIVYDDGMYSFVQNIEVVPIYQLVNNMQLLEIDGDNEAKLVGHFEEMELNKDTFESRFRHSHIEWSGSENPLKDIKKNNRRAWQLYVDGTKNFSKLYILLEQNDGTFYLGYGYYNGTSDNPANPDDSHVRWLYKLRNVSSAGVGGTDGPENVTITESIDDLRETYPEFFDLSTDSGLTVYIWEMAENSYHCYLGNSSIDLLSDYGTFFIGEGGTSIEEMRKILSTYDIDKEDITIMPFTNPISSYAYVIDDEYRERIKEVFWK